MDPMKLKILDAIIQHLTNSQGGDLKSLLDESKAPPMDGSGSDPKGLEISKVSVLGDKPGDMASAVKPDGGVGVDDDSAGPDADDIKGGDDEMSDDELQELLAKCLK